MYVDCSDNPDSRRGSVGYVQTGQISCHDTDGREISCSGSGQDGEFRKGIPWPLPRFEKKDGTVLDLLTGLTWTESANLSEFPVTWQEALSFISRMNREKAFDYQDWRLPNRRELRSLMSYQTRKPALPEEHPFNSVFSGWYWTSTTAAINPSYAWYVHMEGARMFYGKKDQFYLFWPVRGTGNLTLPATGQAECHDMEGNRIACTGTGHDAEHRAGAAWPEPRFQIQGDTVIDSVTGLCWFRDAGLTGRPVSWSEAFHAVAELNREPGARWRLPNINELESLTDCSRYNPALPSAHPFSRVREAYWSSTTSMFEPDWAWALYLSKGAVGVGQKKGAYFFVWPVSSL